MPNASDRSHRVPAHVFSWVFVVALLIFLVTDQGFGQPRTPLSQINTQQTFVGASPTFSQPPTGDGEAVTSGIDLGDGSPNQIVSDDFISDGRPIHHVKWWGSNLGGIFPRPTDDCQLSPSVSEGIFSFDNFDADTDGSLGICATVGSDVWIDYVATCDGTAIIDTCGSSFDTILEVYEGCSCDPLGSLSVCNDDAVDGPCVGPLQVQSFLTLPVTSGQCFKVRIGGFAGVQGDGVLSIFCAGGGGDCSLINGGFEEGDFRGWSAINNGLLESLPWTVGETGTGTGFHFNAPLEGLLDALNGFDGQAGLVYELFQEIVLPPLGPITLTTNHRIQYNSLGLPSLLPREFDITIRDTNNNILTSLFHQEIIVSRSANTDLGWNTQNFDLSTFAGQTVRVHFQQLIPETFTGPALIEYDDLILTCGAPMAIESSTPLRRTSARNHRQPRPENDLWGDTQSFDVWRSHYMKMRDRALRDLDKSNSNYPVTTTDQQRSSGYTPSRRQNMKSESMELYPSQITTTSGRMGQGGYVEQAQITLEPDGWLISFHEAPTVETTTSALAVYFCDQSIITTNPTLINSCDGTDVEEYLVGLDDCCLLRAMPDSRSGLTPAVEGSFNQERCTRYSLGIDAVVGKKFERDPITQECVQVETNTSANGTFWGWVSTGVATGIGTGLQPVTQSSVSRAGADWIYGPWVPTVPICSAPNTAFELLTHAPSTGDKDIDGNGIPDECESDCNLNGIPDGQDITAGTSPDCQPNDVPDECEINDGTSLDTDGNAIPDECQCPPEAPQKENPFIAKNRFITIHPGNPGQQTAIRIIYVDLLPPFDVLNGQSMWVGPPKEICENSGQNANTPLDECGPALGSDSVKPGPTLFTARLQCEPLFLDWSTVTQTIHVYGEMIIPESTYIIQAIDKVCSLSDPTNFSFPLSYLNSIWGDVIGPDCLSRETCTPPDGTVSIVSDVSTVLEMFKNSSFAPGKARADMEPSLIDLKINFTDVTQVLDAFTSKPYPFSPPSSTPCP